MAKLFLSLAAFLILSATPSTISQTAKERQEQSNQARKRLKEKVDKSAKKEAKKLEKERWKVAPGALPIERQLDRAYAMEYELDDYGFKKYIMSEAMSFGDTYDAAKMQALELAKQNLAGMIQSEVGALIENNVSNNQLTQTEAASIVKSVAASKSLIQQSLGRISPIVEMYREVNGNNREVLVRIIYNMEMAKAAAKKAVKQDLEQRGDSLHQRLNEIIKW